MSLGRIHTKGWLLSSTMVVLTSTFPTAFLPISLTFSSCVALAKVVPSQSNLTRHICKPLRTMTDPLVALTGIIQCGTHSGDDAKYGYPAEVLLTSGSPGSSSNRLSFAIRSVLYSHVVQACHLKLRAYFFCLFRHWLPSTSMPEFPFARR